MRRVIGHRLLTFAPLILAVSLVVFVMINLMPGDPARYLAGDNSDPQRIEEIRRELHLDRSLPVQYKDWLTSAVTGDFGTSLIYKAPVLDLVRPRAAVTAWLALYAFAFAIVTATLLATTAASRPGGLLDRALAGACALGLSIPGFWLGMILVLWLAIKHSIFPAIGYKGIGQGLWPWASHLILPAVALGIALAAELTLQLRNSLGEVLASDYILSARAKGVTHWAVLFRHALKNAAVPVVTVLGTRFGQLIAGAVTVETVFALPGLGQLSVQSTSGRDIPVLLAMVILTTLAVAVANLVTDVATAYLNPRLSHP